MALTVTERGAGSASISSPASLAYTGTIPVGDLILCIFSTVSTATVASVTDTQSNTFALAKSSSVNAGIYLYYSVCTHQVTSADHITVTFTGATTPNVRAYLIEQHNITGATWALDTASGLNTAATGTSTSMAMSSGGGTTLDTTLMVNAYAINSNAQTFTQSGGDTKYASAPLGATRELAASYQDLTGGGAGNSPNTNATKTGTQAWDGLMVFFKMVSSGGNKAIAGSFACVTTFAGSIVRQRPIPGGTFSGTTAFSGAIVRLRPFSGTFSATTSFSGDLVRPTRQVAGSFGATTAFSGGVARTRPLIGTFSATTSFSGTVNVPGQSRDIAGSFAAATTFSAGIIRQRRLSGSFSASTGFSGALGVVRHLSGSFGATTGFTAALTRLLRINASFAATSAFQASLARTRPISGGWQADTTFTATLTRLVAIYGGFDAATAFDAIVHNLPRGNASFHAITAFIAAKFILEAPETGKPVMSVGYPAGLLLGSPSDPGSLLGSPGTDVYLKGA